MDKPIRWTSRTSFIFATAAAAVGLGNIWRFPYLAGENGGGAFVLIYLFFVVALGIPLMTSEVILGRMGRSNPARALQNVAVSVHRSPHWGWLGGLTILAGYLILTYYVVISGWVLDYFFRGVLGQFRNSTEMSAINEFTLLQSNPWQMFVTDTVITGATIGVIALGIKRGLERTVLFMFPGLLLLLLILIGYAMTTGHFQEAVRFLFKPAWHEVTARVALIALGQAFFSLNIAMGIIIMFSAYLPKNIPIAGSVVAVCLMDTAVAVLSGLVIFPVVFANHLAPSAGPSLIFRTLPLAFGHIPYGNFIGALFFLLVLFAAFTSTISLLEPAVAWLMEKYKLSRIKAVGLAGIVCWMLSLGTIASFSHGEHFHIFGVTFFRAIDFMTSDVMLPIGGILIAVFTGWLLPSKSIEETFGWSSKNFWFRCWRFIKRYFAPIAIGFILLMSLRIL